MSFLIDPSVKVKYLDNGKKQTYALFIKKDDPSLVNNYRPISLLNSEDKVFERLIFKHLYNHLRDNNVLSSLQSGFIQGDSTVKQLIFLYNTFCQALDMGKEVRVVFCDIRKAFDRVWHAGLLHKLKAAGVQGELLKWFTNYFAGLGGSVGCAVRLETRRSRVQHPLRSATFFRGD